MGLFTSAWKSDNKENAIRAVEKMTAVKTLFSPYFPNNITLVASRTPTYNNLITLLK
jgi:hypothetical protein